MKESRFKERTTIQEMEKLMIVLMHFSMSTVPCIEIDLQEIYLLDLVPGRLNKDKDQSESNLILLITQILC